MLRELPAVTGKILSVGSMAYTSQDSWLFFGTVRQNILFGLPFNLDWYKKVLDACELSKDIQSFPFGDHTLVGDKGMVLSGGQKARISLAR